MLKEEQQKKWYIVGALVLIALISIFVISPVTSSQDFHTSSIKSLDEKKVTVLSISAGIAAISSFLATLPMTTPLANKCMDLNTYLLLIIATIFLEKILLTLSSYVTFTFLIPLSCGLIAVYVFYNYDKLKNLAIKIALFGLVIFFTVPISIKISNIIEDTYKPLISEAISQANETEENNSGFFGFFSDDKATQTPDSEKKEEKSSGWFGFFSDSNDTTASASGNKEEEDSIISNFFTNAKNTITSIDFDSVKKWGKEKLDWGKKKVNGLIDAVAVLVITSCIIPLLVLSFLVWFIKIIFGVSLPEKTLEKFMLKKAAKEGIKLPQTEEESQTYMVSYTKEEEEEKEFKQSNEID